MVNGGMWLNPKGPYKTMEDLWDEPEVIMTENEYQQDIQANQDGKKMSHPIPVSDSSDGNDSEDEYKSAQGSAPSSAQSSPNTSFQQQQQQQRHSFLGGWIGFSRKN
jgi:hypothetical protein